MCTVSKAGRPVLGLVLGPAGLARLAGKRSAAPSPLAVRRKLFLDSEPESAASEPAASLEAELTRGLEASASRWEFDFRAGRPMRTARRFEWSPAGARRPALPSPPTPPTPPSPPSPARQTKITEYLMPRKRAASGEALPPSKMARLSVKAFNPQERQDAQPANGVTAVGKLDYGR